MNEYKENQPIEEGAVNAAGGGVNVKLKTSHHYKMKTSHPL